MAHFTLAANGNLAFAGCIGNRPGCATTDPIGALNGATGLTFSPNGQSLYAGIVHFRCGGLDEPRRSR